MENRQTILDTPEANPENTPPVSIRYHRVFVFVEIFLILITLFGAILRFESWKGTSELFILLMTGLMFFYLLLSPFVFGSVGIRRHLGAFFCGFTIMIGIAAQLFKIESWEGGPELGIIAASLSLMVAFPVLIFSFVRQQTGYKSPVFFWWILLRLLIIAGLNFSAIIDLFL